MKYVKMLGLAAVAAMALMAFVGAGAASATVLCNVKTSTTSCPSPYPAGTMLEMKLVQGGSWILRNLEGGVIDGCKAAEIAEKTEKEGSATETVSTIIIAEHYTWGECTASPTKAISGGTFEIHHVAGTFNGVATVPKMDFTINTILGSCVYRVGGEPTYGTVVGGAPATLSVSTKVKREAGMAVVCTETAIISATYEFVAPNPLYVTQG